MNKIVPFKTNYETIRKFEIAGFYCVLSSALIIGLLWLAPKLDLDASIKSFLIPFKEYLKSLSYVTMIGYLLLSQVAKFLFKNTEKAKRDDLIDNSFGTNYANENTLGYYNNDEIPIGIKKLAINAYESSFHTENTLREMLFKMSLKLLLLSIPFLFSIFSNGGQNITRLLFEISIPTIMLTQFASTIAYFNGVKNLNERFKIELINIGKSELENKDYSKLLIPVMEYYNTKSWANINLDKKIFEKHNNEISRKWLERKESLGIK